MELGLKTVYNIEMDLLGILANIFDIGILCPFDYEIEQNQCLYPPKLNECTNNHGLRSKTN